MKDQEAPAAQAPTELASAAEVSRVDELLQESREQAAVEDALEEALYDHQISVLKEDIVEEEHNKSPFSSFSLPIKDLIYSIFKCIKFII